MEILNNNNNTWTGKILPALHDAGHNIQVPPLYSLFVLGVIISLPFIMEYIEQQQNSYYHSGSRESDESRKTTATPPINKPPQQQKEQKMEPKAAVKLDKEDARRESIAWPTVCLAVAGYGLWLTSLVCHLNGIWSWKYAFPISTLAAYVSFTPLHDSVHNAVSSKHKWLNSIVGWVSGSTLFAPAPLFKFVHLYHHRELNDEGSAPDGSSLDPDKYGGDGDVWFLPFKWSTIFMQYVVFTRKMLRFRREDPDQPLAARKNDEEMASQVLYGFAGMFSAAIALWWIAGERQTLLCCWIFPALLASAILVYFFDYIPHRPHVIPFREDAYASTSALLGPFGLDMTVALLGQNNHQIHHAFPFLPFYRYDQIWRQYREEFIKKGTRELPLLLFPNREEWLEELKLHSE